MPSYSPNNRRPSASSSTKMATLSMCPASKGGIVVRASEIISPNRSSVTSNTVRLRPAPCRRRLSPEPGEQIVFRRRVAGGVLRPDEGLDGEQLLEQVETEIEEERVVRLAGVGLERPELGLGERRAVDVSADELVGRAEVERIG